jgi:hypothetical protein
MIHTYKSYDINDYTFYTRAQDNMSVNQNSNVWIDAYNCDGNRETYYHYVRNSNQRHGSETRAKVIVSDMEK